MRVEIYNANGAKVWDSEIRGNVFDWHVQNGQAQRPVTGDYACVVTVKNVAGRVTQKIGSIQVEEKDVRIATVETGQLSAVQSQAIGPLEEDASWTILSEEQNQTTTIIAHDGTDGQIVRGRGAISFRLGDFFSGRDQEQMRLTEEGKLGVGTPEPKFKLDVAGAIRARQGFVFANGSTLNVNEKGGLTLTDVDGNVTPNAAGTGTQNTVAKWAETGGSGTLTDSSIFDNGRVGIGTTNPGARFHAVGISGSVGAGTLQLDTPNLFSTWTATYPAFEVLNTNQTNNNVSLFQFSDVASGAAHAGIGAVATNHASKFGDLFFFTKGTDGYQPRMGIYDGKVGVGTTMPAQRFHVSGNSFFDGFVGIGMNAPTAMLHIVGPPQPPTRSDFSGTNAAPVLQVIGGKGGNSTEDSGFGGTGASILLQGGTGGDSFHGSGSGGGSGGDITIQPGQGGLGPSSSVGAPGRLFLATSGGEVLLAKNTTFGPGFLSLEVGGPTLIGNPFSLPLGWQLYVDAPDKGLRVRTNTAVSTVASFLNGNVGIGAENPVGNLHIDVPSSGNPIKALTVDVQSFQTSPNAVASYYFKVRDVGAGGASAFLIRGDGNIGMGTDTPNDKLEVNGILRVDSLGTIGETQLCRNLSNQIANCSSSLRYKTNIALFSSGLSFLNQLRPITFDWKEGGKKDVGFGAEDVAKINPLFVTYNDKGEVEGVKYDRLSAVFVNAFKEQQAQIERQQREIDALRKLVCSMSARSICRRKD